MQELEKVIKRAVSLKARVSFDGDLDYQVPPMPSDTKAAVLILVNMYNEPSLILTKRQNHMRKHSGQVAFPGGRFDDADQSLWQTALREAHEEIGLPPNHPLEKIGSLSVHKTITGFEVTPFLALNHQPFPLKAQVEEVAEIFEIPFSEIRTDNFKIEGHEYQGRTRHYYVLPHSEYYIWGATARILHQLASRIENV